VDRPAEPSNHRRFRSTVSPSESRPAVILRSCGPARLPPAPPAHLRHRAPKKPVDRPAETPIHRHFRGTVSTRTARDLALVRTGWLGASGGSAGSQDHGGTAGVQSLAGGAPHRDARRGGGQAGMVCPADLVVCTGRTRTAGSGPSLSVQLDAHAVSYGWAEGLRSARITPAVKFWRPGNLVGLRSVVRGMEAGESR
jgi:hypothetical protein